MLDAGFAAPALFDPVAVLEEHLAVGWEYAVDLVLDAPLEAVAVRVPPALGRLEALDGDRCRLVGSTGNPWWYAEQLAALPVPFRVIGGPELRHTVKVIGERLLAAAEDQESRSGGREAADSVDGNGTRTEQR